MWRKQETNIQPEYTNRILTADNFIRQLARMINRLKGGQNFTPVTVLPAAIVTPIGQYRFDSLEMPDLKVKQKREFLSDTALREQLKELLLSAAEEEQKEHFDPGSNFIQEFFRKLRTKSSLLKIKKKIDELARKINAPQRLRPSYGPFDYDTDSYFVEIDKKGVMRLIETEKGQVHEVRRTRDLDELLYWIFTNITFSMAYKLAMESPTGEMDRRKIIFLFQEELLGKLNPKWKEMKHAEYEVFLKKHPVDDIKGRALEYYDGLRKQIHVDIVENSPSYFRFPPG